MFVTRAKGIRLAGQIRAGIVNWWREFSKSKMGVVGLILFIFITMMVILAPYVATHDPKLYDPIRAVPPSTAHILGTDTWGRDLYSMLLYAGQYSLFVGVVTAAIVIGIATTIGLFAGYFGGIIDEILMRTADVLMVIPRLPLLIVLASFLSPGLQTIMLIIICLGWTRPARQIRALTLSVKHYDYVESTKAAGGSSLHIIFHHIFPNVSGVVVAQFVMEVVAVILLETGLSFLGFGDPLRFTWGQILFFAQQKAALTSGFWWWWLPPGIIITMVCFSLAFIGTTLNDRFVLRLNVRGKD